MSGIHASRRRATPDRSATAAGRDSAAVPPPCPPVAKRRLIIFTRYPEPGTTKTRLIPTLGAEGAAALQTEMTRHMIGVGQRLARGHATELEVRFEGGDRAKMEACFGQGVAYVPQGAGDLGRRLQRAVAAARAAGAEQIVLAGADCPEISPDLLAAAFARLADNDIVLGPARDGGYYLIGLRRAAPELFDGIDWGTDRVCRQTLRRIEQLSLTVAMLDTLADVDRPEDLAAWHRAQASSAPPTRISVIIPTHDEAEYLPATIGRLRALDAVEVIVVDGDSMDGTAEIATRAGCRVLHAPAGRAGQLNAGAASARGETLLFLHADTLLPAGFDAAMHDILDKPGVAGGAFRLHIDKPGWAYRAIETAVNARSRVLDFPYGDQGLFLRRRMFQELGGFGDLPIMEDFEFVRRLRRRGNIEIAPQAVTTSGRRWQRLGPWRTTWINQKIVAGYYLGVAPDRLYRWYHQVK